MKKLTVLFCVLSSLNAPAEGVASNGQGAVGTNSTLAGAAMPEQMAQIVPLSSLNLGEALQGWGSVQANKSVEGRTLQISGQKYTNGVGMHARSVLWINLAGGSQRFTAAVGIDDEVVSPIVYRELRSAYEKGYDEFKKVNGRVIFHIYGDEKLLWKST